MLELAEARFGGLVKAARLKHVCMEQAVGSEIWGLELAEARFGGPVKAAR